jgi:flagellar export protein FliJ
MKPFRFTLEAVQIVRDRATNEALEKYAKSLKARSNAEHELEKAEAALRGHLEEWRARMTRSFSPMDMLQHSHARTELEARRNEKVKLLRDAAQAANKAQAALQLARQKSDVVDRFHDRQKHEFNLAALKEEQHLLDELAAGRREFAQKGFSHA